MARIPTFVLSYRVLFRYFLFVYFLSSLDQQTADIEKRMSALENGEAILDQLHLQVEMQKEMERITSQSDDDKLLSDLENSADEDEVGRALGCR